jgi:hypothetical protein
LVLRKTVEKMEADPILFGTRVLYRANESMEFFSGIDGVLAREQLVLKRVDRAFRSANFIVR